MKKLLQFVPTYLVFFLMIGIVIGYYFNINQQTLIMVLLIEIILLTALYFNVKKQNQHSIYFTLLIYITSITLGIATITFKNELNSKNHFTYFITENTYKESNQAPKHVLKVVILKVLKSAYYQHKYVAKVIAINNQQSIGKVLLNVQADSLTKQFKVDQNLLIYTEFKPIEPPKNPYYFDYQNYLKKQQIHHQIFVKKNELKVLNINTTIVGLAEQLIANINQKLEPYAIAKEELAIINAFLLGARQDVSKDLMESYINAGAIHIMAISGMHFGILFLILNALFKPIERLRNGKLWKMFLIVLLLWMYALIAGLSGSVVRAVLMFSIVAVAMNLQKLTNIFYTLIVSLLILLLINPYFLFEVGFQLSYAAVFSIVIFQPIFQTFWTPNNIILQFYWNIFTVSMAAQIGVLPISLYYFHQFPSLFMFTNFAIIPILGIILIGGLLVFILALLNVLPLILVQSYAKLIFLMNAVVKWIAAQESFLIKNISFDGWMLISLYTIIFLIFIYLKHQNKKHLTLLLVSIFLFQLVLFSSKWKQEKSNELVIFHKSKHSIIGRKEGNRLNYFTDLDSESILKERFLIAYQIRNAIDKIQVDYPKNIFNINNDWVLVVDESTVYQIDIIKPKVIFLQNSPKINLDRLINDLKPTQIIADGSNYASYVKLWASTCKKRKTPFHHTGQKGAFILK